MRIEIPYLKKFPILDYRNEYMHKHIWKNIYRKGLETMNLLPNTEINTEFNMINFYNYIININNDLK